MRVSEVAISGIKGRGDSAWRGERTCRASSAVYAVRAGASRATKSETRCERAGEGRRKSERGGGADARREQGGESRTNLGAHPLSPSPPRNLNQARLAPESEAESTKTCEFCAPAAYR